jgi:5-methylcytosine-specific restriction endonuclease McrA
MSRVHNIMTWVRRLALVCPIAAISQELVRFDLQKLENPEISGAAYQQGTLFGYEVREYLLQKWNRTCGYCGVTDTRLEVEHITPRSKGGSDRVSNLTIACVSCNQTKGNRDIREFLTDKPGRLARILKTAKVPLKDATAVNATRWELYRQLQATGLLVETGTGGQTKYNRTRLNLPKTHYWDAASVGESTPESLIVKGVNPVIIKATGHGNRQMAQMNKFGFPKLNKDGSQVVRTRQKEFHGFKTGNMVRAIVPTGKNAGNHVGRVTVRAGRVFDLTTSKGRLQSINWKYFQPIWKTDGYSYSYLSSNVQ